MREWTREHKGQRDDDDAQNHQHTSVWRNELTEQVRIVVILK